MVLSKKKLKFSTLVYLADICSSDEKVRFQVLMVASMKMAVFWNLVPCSLVEID
jgi:hypothetical protein